MMQVAQTSTYSWQSIWRSACCGLEWRNRNCRWRRI